jgi:hypothetical protein
MKTAVVFLVVGLACLSAACDRVPGTPQNRARVALKPYLIDPSSAKIEIIKASAESVCGTVNAKNRMGAYVGAMPFVVESKYSDPVVFSEPTIFDFTLWNDSPNSSSGREAYQRLENGCTFRSRWAASCDSSTANAIMVDEQLCRLWNTEDYAGLRRMRGY